MESEGRGRREKWGMIMEGQRGEEHGQIDGKEGREERIMDRSTVKRVERRE